MKQPEPTVFVVDDDPSVLKAVSRLLRSAGFIANAFGSPQKFLDSADLNAHGCIVLDISMPKCSGLELQKALISRGSTLPILFLTGQADVRTSVRAMKDGAVDFLTKPIDEKEFLSAVRSAIAKDQLTHAKRLQDAEIRKCLLKLTPREYEVFEHVVSGRLNKQTAADLGTVEKTIKVHRARVMEKLEVQSLADLVRLAERAGITSPASAE